MKTRCNAVILASWSIQLVIVGATQAQNDETLALLRLMPADAAMSAVVVNFEKLNESLVSLQKRFDSDSIDQGPLEELKSDLKVAEWADFSKPFGIAGRTLSDEDDAVAWLHVAGFATKVKEITGAAQQDGVWRIPIDETKELYVKSVGVYVVAARNKASLEKATKGGRSLADELSPRADLFRGRDAYFHMNIDPVRDSALGGIAQMTQMIPMFAMVLAQQGGSADPAIVSAVFEKLFDAANKFVEQLAYVDMAIALDENAAKLTVASGYLDGPIKSYLAKQKPAGIKPFSKTADEPYAIAMSYHFPGDQSPFYDYLIEQMRAVVKKSPAPATGDQAAAPTATEEEKAANEVIDLLAELYRNIEGAEAVMTATPAGVTAKGDYIGPNTTTIMKLVKQLLTAEYPLVARLKGGVKFEALGTRNVGDVAVEEFTMKVDPNHPTGAAIASIYGDQMRFSIGVVGERVRFCVGDESEVEKFFGKKVKTSFASSSYTANALAKLPAKRNAVVLIDPARFAPLLAPLMGSQTTEPVPPGPPIAISSSFAGEPARLDIHVPWRAIDRAIKALTPPAPKKPAPDKSVDPVP